VRELRNLVEAVLAMGEAPELNETRAPAPAQELERRRSPIHGWS